MSEARIYRIKTIISVPAESKEDAYNQVDLLRKFLSYNQTTNIATLNVDLRIIDVEGE